MNANKYLVHALWGIGAMATFGMGMLLGKSGNTSEAESNAKNTSKTSAIAADSPWRSGDSAEADADGAVEKIATTAVANSGKVLSADAMKVRMADILRETNPVVRNRMFAELLEQLTPENIQAAVETMRDSGLDPSNFRDMGLLTYMWGKLDPAKALAYADSMDGRGKAFVSSSALSGWASQDPASAMAWFREGTFEGFEKNIMARGLMEGILQKDLSAAKQMAKQETDAEVQGQFYDLIAREQIKKGGVDSARAWIDNELSTAGINPNSMERAASQVAEAWAKTNPKGAAEWAMALPEGETRQEALEEVVRDWTRVDANAASEFLNAMPVSETRDRAVQDFAEVIANDDPKTAMSWADTITDESRRERTLVRAAQEWYQKDAEAAGAWAATSGLSEEAQKRVSSPPDRGRRGGGPPWGRGGMR